MFQIILIASTARDERSELYGREYDQGKVTYNGIYFQQKSLWPIFSSFFLPDVVTASWQNWLVTAFHKIGALLISVTKWQKTCVNKGHEHILLIILIIYYWFTYMFIFWYSFWHDAVKDFWRDYCCARIWAKPIFVLNLLNMDIYFWSLILCLL